MKMLSFLLIILASLIIPGIISITKAKMSGRKSPSLFQPLYDVLRLLRKGSIYSNTTTVIFQIAPIIYFSSIIIAILFIPFGLRGGVFSFNGDFIYFAYILGLGKFLLIISAMDTGSGFEGMGANREALYSMLIEPAFFIIMGSAALLSNKSSFYDFYAFFHYQSFLYYFIAVLSIYLFIQIAMIENSRLLVDDPKTHLELTMIHEVMVLDTSGFDMGLVHISTWLKFSLYSSLIANYFLIKGLSIIWHIAIFFGVAVIFAIIVGLLESFRARNKIAKNPEWILTFSSISLVIYLTVLFILHK